MRVGVSEDEVRQTSLVAAKARLDMLRLAGLDSVRVSATWAPGQTAPSAEDLPRLTNALSGAALVGLKAYVSVSQFGSATTPLTEENQDAFAEYTAAIATAFPALAGIIVGNEPNINRFWLPQFNPDGTDAAAPAYEKLLAKTYDAVKAAQPRIQVIGAALSPHGGDNPGGARPTIRRRSSSAISEPHIARASGRRRSWTSSRFIRTATTRASRRSSCTHRRRSRWPTTPSSSRCSVRRSTERRSRARRCRSSTTSTASSPGSPLPPRRSTPAASRRRPSRSTRQHRLRTTRLRCRRRSASRTSSACCSSTRSTRATSTAGSRALYYANLMPKSSLPAVRDAAQTVRRGVAAHCDGLQLTPQLRYLYWPRGKLFRQGHVRVTFTCDIDCHYVAKIATQTVMADAVGRERTTVDFPILVRKGTYRIRLTLTAPDEPWTAAVCRQ